MLDGVKLSGFRFTDRSFDHILILNAKRDFDIISLVKVCNKIDFPLSQIYFFGTKQHKTYYKKHLFPYWKTKNISDFLDKHRKLLRLTGKFFVITQDFSAFLQFSDYINNISTLSIISTPIERVRVFNGLYDYGFTCKNTEGKKSLWVRNFQ